MENWLERLKSMEYFSPLITDQFLKDAKVVLQIQEAKRLKLPFRVFVPDGFELPMWFTDGIEDLKVARLNKNCPMRSAVIKASRELFGTDYPKDWWYFEQL